MIPLIQMLNSPGLTSLGIHDSDSPSGVKQEAIGESGEMVWEGWRVSEPDGCISQSERRPMRCPEGRSKLKPNPGESGNVPVEPASRLS